MPALNFQSQFAPLVESGEKRQTIRKHRKGNRDPKVGDTLYLYTGMRTKQCRKLGEVVCTNIDRIAISWSWKERGIVALCGSPFESDELARRDGFESWSDMVDWFEKTHGLPFEGLLIRWGISDD